MRRIFYGAIFFGTASFISISCSVPTAVPKGSLASVKTSRYCLTSSLNFCSFVGILQFARCELHYFVYVVFDFNI